ncbi:hypothetical protein ACWCXB_26640 [Streptomyces sp. NPDC001514]
MTAIGPTTDAVPSDGHAPLDDRGPGVRPPTIAAHPSCAGCARPVARRSVSEAGRPTRKHAATVDPARSAQIERGSLTRCGD